jgi:NADPH-dependent ferric siderophore reductase
VSTSPEDRPSPGRIERGRPVPLRATVAAVERITPHLVRIVVTGDDLANFVWSGPAAHFTLVLPGPGRGVDALPAAGGRDAARPDRGAQTRRTYTPRHWDPVTRRLTFDIVVHGDGPASRWGAAARVGDELAVTSPLGRYDVERTAPWLVLAGDESALPAIATILAVTPPDLPTTVLAEIGTASDEHDLGADDGVDVRWLHRHTRPPGELLGETLRRVVPAGDGRVWVACEAGAMLVIRRWLIDERSLDRRAVSTRGYWSLGRTEGRTEPAPGASRWLRDPAPGPPVP